MNLRILVLKTEKLSDFPRRGSQLFNSITVDRKKEFLKKGDVMYISSRLCGAFGRNQAEEILSILIFQDLIKSQSFLHQRRSQRDSNLNSG